MACARVNTVGEALEDPHVHARGLVRTAHHATYGSYRHVAGPIPSMSVSRDVGAPLSLTTPSLSSWNSAMTALRSSVLQKQALSPSPQLAADRADVEGTGRLLLDACARGLRQRMNEIAEQTVYGSDNAVRLALFCDKAIHEVNLSGAPG